MAKRPLTAREIKETETIVDDNVVNILNTSRQLIKIHMKPPAGVDFFLAAQDVSLRPNQQYAFRASRLWHEQIDRLCKQRKLQVINIKK